MAKQTFQPKKKKHTTTHGFLTRMSSKKGQDVIKRRRQKGRVRLAL